jgi:outer membrane protein assembly factor BamB
MVLVPAEEASTSYWYSVDAGTGQIIWRQKTERYDYLRCLTDRYLVVSGPRSFFNLETHTGKIVWQKDHAGTASCSQDTVFYSEVPRNSISAADLATGQELWVGTQSQMSFDGVIYNPGTKEILATHAQDFYVIEPQTGLLKDSFNIVGVAPTGGPPWQHGSMYLIDRGELFLGDTVLDDQTGQIIRKGMEYGTNRPPTVTEDTMHLVALDKGVIAFDRAGYDIRWIYPPPQPQSGTGSLGTLSAAAILDDIGYVIFSDATLRAFDLETGQELGYWQPNKEDLWTWRVCTYPYPRSDCVEAAETGLTTSEDMLFVSFGNGKLYAFGKGE